MPRENPEVVMNKSFLGCAFALCGTVAFAQAPPPTESQPRTNPDMPRADTSRKMGLHKMTATVVATDESGQQITVRNLSMGKSMAGSTSTGSDEAVTLKVEGKAVSSLASVKAGDSITVSCKPGVSPTTTDPSSASVSGQALADQHCAAVTEIGTSKTPR
jgi:hypothetical protein